MAEGDHQAAEDDAPVLSNISSDTLPAAAQLGKTVPTTPIIIRSAYKSDVENNDDLPDDNTSPILYTGSGVVHAKKSASNDKPDMHMWLEMIQLWPKAVETLREKGYDTFTFTPYSSRAKWNKTYPEMTIELIIRIKRQAKRQPSKSVERKSSNDGKITLTMLLTAAVVCFLAVLAHDIGYILFGTNEEQRCLATDNNELGLREKTEMLFGGNKIPIEEHAEALISWLNKEGGYFHPNLQIRRVDPSDPTSYLGLFVNDFVPEGEVILRVPRSMVLDSTEKIPVRDVMNCNTIRNLIEQIKLKDESKYAPYVNYLIDTQIPSIPIAWSQAGKDLFNRVIDTSDFYFPWVDELVPAKWSEVVNDVLLFVTGQADNVRVLPPYYPRHWLQSWHEGCNGSDDPLEEYAALFTIHRSWDDLMIPIFDNMNHRNGRWVNTNSSNVYDPRKDIEVKASRDIKANEQLYMSYNRCENCENRIYEFGTDRILWDYGFVEQMPQSFYFPEMQFGYRLDETGSGEAYVTEWVYKKPSSDHVETMKQMLRQISWKKATELSKQCGVNDNEWETINNYVNALENGLKAAVKGVEKGGIEVVGEEIPEKVEKVIHKTK